MPASLDNVRRPHYDFFSFNDLVIRRRGDLHMARLKSPQLTERELAVMQVFWDTPGREHTIAEVRDTLAERKCALAYTTVATFVGILVRKKCLSQTNDERPFRYRPLRSAEDISQGLLKDLLQRVFRGSRPALLKCLLGQEHLTARERAEIHHLLQDDKQ